MLSRNSSRVISRSICCFLRPNVQRNKIETFQNTKGLKQDRFNLPKTNGLPGLLFLKSLSKST